MGQEAIPASSPSALGLKTASPFPLHGEYGLRFDYYIYCCQKGGVGEINNYCEDIYIPPYNNTH